MPSVCRCLLLTLLFGSIKKYFAMSNGCRQFAMSNGCRADAVQGQGQCVLVFPHEPGCTVWRELAPILITYQVPSPRKHGCPKQERRVHGHLSAPSANKIPSADDDVLIFQIAIMLQCILFSIISYFHKNKKNGKKETFSFSVQLLHSRVS